MKSKFLFIMLFSLCAISNYAQGYVSIKGKVLAPKSYNEVKLFKTIDGRGEVVATTTLSNEGTYGFLYAPEDPGFYALGTDRMNFLIYLKGGEEINIDLDKTDARLNGKNSKENKALYKWNDFAASVRFKSVNFMFTHSNYKDFFPEFEKFLAEKTAIVKQLKTGNSTFDKQLLSLTDYETDYFAISMLMTPRTIHPKRSQCPIYYDSIPSKDKFVDESVLAFPHGIRMMQSYASYCSMYVGEKPEGPEEYTNKCLSYLHNPRLKGEFIVNNNFQRMKSYNHYLDGLKKYEQYLVTPSLKERAETIGSNIYDTRSGSVAADFTYPDVNGEMVSLSQFKGKVVLVDVWATWCGPCKKEIPYLIKLEKEMHGTDLVVLGVSLDEAEDKQKWLDFIKEKGLCGVQLHASGWSKITKDYKIKGIPNFMVFDKKGNIVTADAPRPSNPALKKLLEEELKK